MREKNKILIIDNSLEVAELLGEAFFSDEFIIDIGSYIDIESIIEKIQIEDFNYSLIILGSGVEGIGIFRGIHFAEYLDDQDVKIPYGFWTCLPMAMFKGEVEKASLKNLFCIEKPSISQQKELDMIKSFALRENNKLLNLKGLL